jgi:hypothetical protein
MALYIKRDPSQAIVFYRSLLFFPCGSESNLLIRGGFNPKMSSLLISVKEIGKFKPDRLRITSDHAAAKLAENAIF